MTEKKKSYKQVSKVYSEFLKKRNIQTYDISRVNGDKVTVEWLCSTGFKEPFLVKDHSKLGLKVPPQLDIDQLVNYIGSDTPVTLIDVEQQKEERGTWSFADWASYFEDPYHRSKVYNSISLEFSDTNFASKVKPPTFVKKISWVENYWPLTVEYPRVQLYCLMSIEGSYTDFHIDFGGSSVWYHMLRGEKIFYLCQPTEENLSWYAKWSAEATESKLSPIETTESFLNHVGNACTKISIRAGDTLVIPTGWIHAVYTPVDSIAIGGNFLHGFNIPMQLRINEIEGFLDNKFRFPLFRCVSWYAAQYYYCCITKSGKFSSSKLRKLNSWETDGMEALIDAMRTWVNDAEKCDGPLDDIDRKSKATAFMVSQSMNFDHPLDFINAFSAALASLKGLSVPEQKIQAAQRPKNKKKSSESVMLRLKLSNAKVDAAACSEHEDTWVIQCPCGLHATNYDDGLRMITCDSCEIWQHTMCVGIPDNESPPPYFQCNNCKASKSSRKIKLVDKSEKKSDQEDWMVNCSCGVSARNYDDGWRLVYCTGCNTWQHTECAGIADDEEGPANYLCFGCQETNPKSKPDKSVADESPINPDDDEDYSDHDAKKKRHDRRHVTKYCKRSQDSQKKESSEPKGPTLSRKRKGKTVRERLFRKFSVRGKK